VECARTYSFPCWRKRGLRHQRTESSNTPLKDFSLISGTSSPFQRTGVHVPLRDQVREDLINSLQNCLGIEELLHAEILQTRERLWMGRQSDAYYDGMLVGSFRGIRRNYAYSGWGVSAWRRLTRGAAQFFSTSWEYRGNPEHLSR
jgi:hypothetical protein